jgi:uncharacterized protein YbbK (DUF523 family)
MQSKPFILISSCLMGENVKYNGGNNAIDPALLQRLRDSAELIPVCPEVAGGLPIPRIPAEGVGEKVVNQAGVDVTAFFEKGAGAALNAARAHHAVAAILKERSPSCGVHQVYDGTFSKRLIDGGGKTTTLLRQHGIKIFNENEIEECLEYIKLSNKT